MTFAFENVPIKELDNCGFFVPEDAHHILCDSVNHVYKGLTSRKTINKDTTILYYPGSFGSFHAGHLSVIHAAYTMISKRTDNFVIIVSPANSSYVAMKYGDTSVRASNKMRYDAIKRELYIPPLDMNVWVDLNPMLNNTCDQNFDVLIEQFVKLNLDCTVDELSNVPILLCGKDRDFSKIMEYTDKLEVFFHEDDTGCGTSSSENKFIQRKHLILRIHNHDEYKLFNEFFGWHYKSITPQYIETEKYVALKYAKMNGIKYTNCKDYADFLNYVPLSRNWINPLEHRGFIYDENRLKSLSGVKMLDSDSFTGSTSTYLKSMYGIKCIPLIDLTDKDDVELLDIEDFYIWNYPHVDLSYRCSMPAFTLKDHFKFNHFIKELRNKA